MKQSGFPSDGIVAPRVEEKPSLMLGLGYFAIAGCAIFVASILIADFVVPHHDWIADTISDLGAGRYEYIVDIGIYAFSAALIAIALLSAHVHLGDWTWSAGIIGFACLGLVVFLVGARNEYGDSDTDGAVIHVYLVYVLGGLFALVPLAMAKGLARVDRVYGRILKTLSVLWIVSAPPFFFMPDSIDGIYERYLGLIAMSVVILISTVFIRRGRMKRANAPAG